MNFLKLLFVVVGLSAFTFKAYSYDYDLCHTQYTELHYATTHCVEIQRPLFEDSEEHFRMKGIFINVDQVEPASVPTVIFVPGGPGDQAEDYKWFLDKRYIVNGIYMYLGVNVVFYDPRGTGQSLFPLDNRNYNHQVISTQNNVEDLKRIIEEVSPHRPVILLSHSAGSLIAMKLASQYPELVGGLMMISPLANIRQLAELQNLFYGKTFPPFYEFVKNLKDQELASTLLRQFDYVEESLNQQEKARILRKYVNPRFPDRTSYGLRKMILRQMLNGDEGLAEMKANLETLEQSIRRLDKYYPVAPKALKATQLELSKLPATPYSDRGVIRATILCAEAFSVPLSQRPTYLDGLQLNMFCRNVEGTVGEAQWEVDYTKIKIPTLVLTGSVDSDLPPFFQSELLNFIPQAEQVVADKAGHMVVDTKPMDFFNSLEKLILKVKGAQP